MAKTIRVVSWNVNGLRACARKGFLEWLAKSRAQIVGLQEVRVSSEDLEPRLRRPVRWHTAFSAAEKKGYSGVGLFSRRAPTWVRTSLGESRFDREGRLQIALFGRLVVVNCYFPKGSGRLRDNSRVPYKLAFYRALFEHIDGLRRAGDRRQLFLPVSANQICRSQPGFFGGLSKLVVVEAVEGVGNAERSPSGCGKRSDRSGFQGPVGEPSEAAALP